MFDKRTLTELGGWTGYRVADLEYRPGEGWMGRGKLLIRLESRSKAMRCSRCGKQSRSVHDTTIRRIRDLPILDWDVALIVLHVVIHRLPSRRLWCEHCGDPSGGAGLAFAAPSGGPAAGSGHRAPTR